MKQKQFINRAIIRSILTGLFYLLMPIPLRYYHQLIGNEYIEYACFGGAIFIGGSVIMLVRSWGLALDSDMRKKYNDENR